LNSRIKNVFGAGSAYFVGGDAVGAGIDQGDKGIPKSFEAVGFKTALKDGVLDAHAIIFAKFGDFVKAFGVGDIVGDEGEHLFVGATVTRSFGGGEAEGESRFPPPLRRAKPRG
jgi:hypothetical protein